MQIFAIMKKHPQTLNRSLDERLRAFVAMTSNKVSDENIELAEHASALLATLLENSETSTLKDLLDIIVVISARYSGDSTVTLRYASLYANVSVLSDSHFDACVASGAIVVVETICRNRDELVQVIINMIVILNCTFDILYFRS